jgi:hypothetical protein
MSNSKVTIYVLQLSENKWYVGRTTNLKRRLNEHWKHKGSDWTRRYSPKAVLTYPNCDIFDEDKYTKMFMAKYGIDNVRGGSYSNFHLTQQQKENIIQEIRNATNSCFHCGSPNHFAIDCPSRKTYSRLLNTQKNQHTKREHKQGHYVQKKQQHNTLQKYSDAPSHKHEMSMCSIL